MNKRQFVEAYAERTGTTKAAATQAVDIFLGLIRDTVASGQQIAITGFGTFSRVERPARSGYNPATEGHWHVPATSVPKFKPGSSFAEQVANEGAKARAAS